MKKTNSINLMKLICMGLVLASTSMLPAQTIWHVKAIDPSGKFLDVKAFDKEGKMYDVKALEEDNNTLFMDIKALKGDQKLPIKMLLNKDAYFPVKAIDSNGMIYDIKALSGSKKLDVKGVSQAGNIIHLKAIGEDGEYYGVKAISTEGEMRDVKGVKFNTSERETVVNGVEIRAHVKALPQVPGTSTDYLWNVKAVHPEGKLLDLKAMDEKEQIYDVKAFVENGNLHLLDIKAIIGGQKCPVKVLASTDKYAPVKAIGPDGKVYNIKALTADKKILDVKGVSHSGKLIHIKAIGSNGIMYGVKAISPGGQLYNVKGIESEDEMMISGIKVRAHVKALPQ